jgi:polyisoprenoid-binding protein YceI
MKKQFLFALPVFALIGLMSFNATMNTYELDGAHSGLRFGVTHMGMSTVEGFFTKCNSKFVVSKDDFSDAVIKFNAEVGSINTFNEYRDKDLLAEGYFDSDKFKTIEFNSTGVKVLDNHKVIVVGNITMHGVTKPAEFEGTLINGKNLMSGKETVAYHMTGTVKRSDFELMPKLPTAIVSDEVEITANGELTKM